ncbi:MULTISPECIES: glycoside hydrolase family 28 protein [unclassified Bradyrhizobium]|uniref:rhamnogalacturonidase n=1 Tax=unclassified Bradyrhizobium TaxID=2631580 RepID=UPI002479BA1D|nr:MULTISPECIES: glycoside hydrolase family 28 protein [unclassified Bradyrhizobium]WGR82287.1 glycoside hydrolase family 28 protein [Bradyrhizobium sp. ISRA430]
MDRFRREFLTLASKAAASIGCAMISPDTSAAAAPTSGASTVFDARSFGAIGDGKAIDSPAINRAIEAAGSMGGTVYFPAGRYACYSLRLKSAVALYLDEGCVIIAADTPREGTASGYDPAESNGPWEAFQDFGHNHWHNSLIWGESIHDVAIFGPGLIWGRGLARGHDDPDLPLAEAPGVGNKAIALKNCHNVTLRDLSMLACGHFAVLATGVDNLTIDNLKIDTNRDGINIDCCRNVRISNCSINSPWDDAICPKSSFALGYARPTENVTIANCYVTGGFQVGSLIDGSFKPFPGTYEDHGWQRTGRIKCGTESNGGFRNIAISSCVFESCRGLALETVDGGIMEDITVTGVTMRDIRNAPLFLRLGSRLRGPAGITVGALKRVLISNVTCNAPLNDMPSIISGVPGHAVEDVKISDCYFLHKGGGTAEMAELQPVERPNDYPEPALFGPLPAQHFYIRHARNLEFNNVELRAVTADARPSLWLGDLNSADLTHVKFPSSIGPTVSFNDVSDFRAFANRGLKDVSIEGRISHMQL